MQKFFKEHLKVRQKVLEAEGPNIPEESTTIRFIVETLNASHKYATVAQSLASGDMLIQMQD